MLRRYRGIPIVPWILCGVAVALAVSSSSSRAQDAVGNAGSSGYAVGESNVPDPEATAANASAGPVRLARFAYVQGNVTWRADQSLDWAGATSNLPLKQGAQIWVASGGRAEVQFDDGSYLRLGSGAIATLQVLYSDTNGEFTEIGLTSGLSMLKVKHEASIYQLDTPLVSVKAGGPSRVRIGVSGGVDIGVPEGSAAIEGAHGTAELNRGDYITIQDANSPYNVRQLPGPDLWERWNVDRESTLDNAEQALVQHNVPANICLVAGDLDSYGTWRTDATYGEVWCPRAVDGNWRPYYAGHWTWVNPFGWTWCSDEPWGWAPYHYGTWFHAGYGWAWRPGPVNQYWCPAVVNFTESGGNIAWCALAPSEVHYPVAFAVGFRGARWSAFFSIGQAGCYYPAGNYCVGRAFSTVYVNRRSYFNENRGFGAGGSLHGGIAFAVNNNSYVSGHHFVPINARNAAGAIFSTQTAFGGRGGFNAVPRGSTALFAQGRTIGAPTLGHAAIAGPPIVRPTAAALVPNRSYVRPAAQTAGAANRTVFRSALPGAVAKSGIGQVRGNTGIGTSGRPGTSIGSSSNVTRPGFGGTPGRQPNSAAQASAAARTALGSGRGGAGTAGTSGNTGNVPRTLPRGNTNGTGGSFNRGGAGNATGGNANPRGGTTGQRQPNTTGGSFNRGNAGSTIGGNANPRGGTTGQRQPNTLGGSFNRGSTNPRGSSTTSPRQPNPAGDTTPRSGANSGGGKPPTPGGARGRQPSGGSRPGGAAGAGGTKDKNDKKKVGN